MRAPTGREIPKTQRVMVGGYKRSSDERICFAAKTKISQTTLLQFLRTMCVAFCHHKPFFDILCVGGLLKKPRKHENLLERKYSRLVTNPEMSQTGMHFSSALLLPASRPPPVHH